LNVTNGITPRRWLLDCNPQLAKLVFKTINKDDLWSNLDLLEDLRTHADNTQLQAQWMRIKYENKKRLAKYLKDTLKVDVDPTSLFDIQIKRIHEYKRQLLNIMRVIFHYSDLKKKLTASGVSATASSIDPSVIKELNTVPRVVIFAGKAAPGYQRAKEIIKLINNVAERINNDRLISQFLKVVFIPNYSVSLAEIIIPASDISQVRVSTDLIVHK
jgi:starch phosphorylase